MQDQEQEQLLRARGVTGEGLFLSKGVNFTLFVVSIAWAAASTSVSLRSAQGLTDRLDLGPIKPLLSALFLLFLVVVGFHLLDWIATRGRCEGGVLPLPRRSTSMREWATGAAIGWGLCLAAVLPLLLTGNLHIGLSWQPGAKAMLAGSLLLGVATLFVLSLAEEAIFRGYPFRRLMQAAGPSWAAIATSLVFAILLLQADAQRHALLALLDGVLFGLVLAMAWLRTHALWLGWGLRFAYRSVMVMIFGLPSGGRAQFGSIADTFTTGPGWLSGGTFGVDAGLLTALVMLGGLIVLYRATRQFAWDYTRRAIVAAGYEVTVAPPAAHVAMEKAAPSAPALVQILPVTPQSGSTTNWRKDD